jgi:alpha-amylase/alpha-mannosidase (GH57 family)
VKDRFLCIHGHFYQPPRENPWLGIIERQESAYPYNDWNERVTAECYAPNAASRILDRDGRITEIVNNYAWISFDFGPTLLAWLEENAPETYEAVIRADRASIDRYGRGSAMAQAYGHMILPLASERDIRTQVLWGMHDFRARFGRDAEGMWLPETAVDTRTLETLAEAGVRFTILSPAQAAATRSLDGQWTEINDDHIDPSLPYLVRLPSGRAITVFFYDGPASRAVAFESLLGDGQKFAQRLIGNTRHDENRLVSIATDGETYGHHHRHGDMAMAFALHALEAGTEARITNYASWLDGHAPAHEVRIRENTSWSCVHGIERWRSDCGCHTGGQHGWTQAWRAPLREALDWLRDTVAPLFEMQATALLHDPWAARDDYINVVLDCSEPTIAAFLTKHARGTPDAGETTRILELLELQNHAMLMYTSCGWFFNDLAGIETVQILRYAGRVVQLAEKRFGHPLEEDFQRRLERAASNDRAAGDGRALYERHVKPAIVDLLHVGAHFAVSSVFPGHETEGRVYRYKVDVEEQSTSSSNDATLSVGLIRATSDTTRETERLTWAVLHFGNHNLSGGIRRFAGEDAHATLRSSLLDSFEEPDLARVISLLAEFPEYTFSLRSLFPERQRQILYRLIAANLREAEGTFRRVYDANLSLMRSMSDLGMALPRAFHVAAEFVLNRDLSRAFASEPIDLRFARTLLEQARTTHVTIDRSGLAFVIQQALERLSRRFASEAPATQALEDLLELMALARGAGFDLDLWRVQNDYWRARKSVQPVIMERSAHDDAAVRWINLFSTVGAQLAVAVKSDSPPAAMAGAPD